MAIHKDMTYSEYIYALIPVYTSTPGTLTYCSPRDRTNDYMYLGFFSKWANLIFFATKVYGRCK